MFRNSAPRLDASSDRTSPHSSRAFSKKSVGALPNRCALRLRAAMKLLRRNDALPSVDRVDFFHGVRRDLARALRLSARDDVSRNGFAARAPEFFSRSPSPRSALCGSRFARTRTRRDRARLRRDGHARRGDRIRRRVSRDRDVPAGARVHAFSRRRMATRKRIATSASRSRLRFSTPRKFGERLRRARRSAQRRWPRSRSQRRSHA